MIVHICQRRNSKNEPEIIGVFASEVLAQVHCEIELRKGLGWCWHTAHKLLGTPELYNFCTDAEMNALVRGNLEAEHAED